VRTVVAFGRFWYDFVIGDDWRMAVGVVAAIVSTNVLSRHDLPAWWVLPAAVVGLLSLSLADHDDG
jgi:hypothetical protein